MMTFTHYGFAIRIKPNDLHKVAVEQLNGCLCWTCCKRQRDQADHVGTAAKCPVNINQPDTTTTQNRDSGRNTFQPSRISWS